MITRTLIFGSDAVMEFQKTGVVPPDEWLDEHGGHVEEMCFKSMDEHNAYIKALVDCDGWHAYDYAENNPVEEKCPYCKEWQSFFADRENNVYCPDCGSLIIPAKQGEEITSTKLQFRTPGNPEWRDFPAIPAVDNFNNDFSAEFLHNYYSSNYVVWEGDMQKFIDDEITLEEFKALRHDFPTKWQAKEEMKRLRQIILNETMEDFLADLVAGKIEFRRVQITQ